MRMRLITVKEVWTSSQDNVKRFLEVIKTRFEMSSTYNKIRIVNNVHISNEHNRRCNSVYTTDKDNFQLATLKIKDNTIQYYSKKHFESFSFVLHIKKKF